MNDNLLIAIFMTLIAGLSTGIGSVIAFFAKKANTNFLGGSLGFSAGVMIYVSFGEIMPSAIEKLTSFYGGKTGSLYATLAFFGGIIFIALIEKLIPVAENPYEIKVEKGKGFGESDSRGNKALMRTGVFTALAIAIHNFPEGLVTFIAAMEDPTVALPIVVAVAIHNIPEGIAVSMPIFYATGDRKKAFKYSLLSGLTEPVGAIVGYLILRPFITESLFGILFAAIAGIMVFISLDELLPSARQYGEPKLSVYGLVGGMAIMAVSLIMMM